MENIKILNGGESLFIKDRNTLKLINNGLTVDCIGGGNEIYIGTNCRLNNVKIIINSNNNKIFIGDNVSISGTIIMKIVDGNTLIIGDNTSIGGASFICGEGKSITIGEDCMIAWNIEFRNTDSHAIFDLDTHERVNFAEDIKIHNNVWIGAHTTILKGAEISAGSVVAIKSLVSKKFEEKNIILAGVPARVVKKNVYWKRELLG